MKNKTALITGSYGGLGTCFVNIHAGHGGNLILVGRSQKKLDEQAESVKKQMAWKSIRLQPIFPFRKRRR